MTSTLLHELARSLYYAPAPTLTLDVDDYVVDYNLALEAIAEDELNGIRHQPVQRLLDRLAPRIIRGALLPAVGNRESPSGCVVAGGELGNVRLSAAAAICRDAVTNHDVGRIITWSIACWESNDRFHERYREKLDHQLTWDTYAWSYDRILPLMPYYKEVLERHVNAFANAPDGPIVDMGAGTGQLAQRLIEAGRRVTAIDSSRAMLDKLLSKPSLAGELGQRLTVLEASAESLPMLEDESFIGVNLQLALFDMNDPEKALATAQRILRRGGWIVVTELKRCFQLQPILAECNRQLHDLGLYEELANDLERVVRSNHALAPGSRTPLRAEDVFDLLAAHGFQQLSLRDSHFGQCATVMGQKPG